MDHEGAGGGIFVFELIGELAAAERVEGHFETWDALQTPIGIGERLDELAFAWTLGAKFLGIAVAMALVEDGIV